MESQDAQPSNKDVRDQIITLFQHEIEHLENLRDILESERRILGSHDVEEIDSSSGTKRTAVSALENASRRRFEYLTKLGINPQEENWFNRVLHLTGNDEKLQATHEHLIAATNQCRSMNQINGLLINRRERLTSEVINLLRANDVTPIYSEQGHSVSSSSARTIGKA